jgi:superfamily I DNA/RNA helicase
LIVDEYQDLNPMDLEFAAIVNVGTKTFVAGDDDRSIYSFRFALTRGIQIFPTDHPNCGDHMLRYCFRCSTQVLAAAQAVITGHPSANRISKNIVSLPEIVDNAVNSWRRGHRLPKLGYRQTRIVAHHLRKRFFGLGHPRMFA